MLKYENRPGSLLSKLHNWKARLLGRTTTIVLLSQFTPILAQFAFIRQGVTSVVCSYI